MNIRTHIATQFAVQLSNILPMEECNAAALLYADNLIVKLNASETDTGPTQEEQLKTIAQLRDQHDKFVDTLAELRTYLMKSDQTPDVVALQSIIEAAIVATTIALPPFPFLDPTSTEPAAKVIQQLKAELEIARAANDFEASKSVEEAESEK
jgi:hypothetical protein